MKRNKFWLIIFGLALGPMFFLAPGTAQAWLIGFDFDGGDGLTQASYYSVRTANLYDGATWWYGWTSVANITERDRGGTDLLLRDFHFSNQTRIFRTDLSESWYEVTLHFFDSSYSHDNIKVTVTAEGSLVLDDVDVVKGQWVTETFKIRVADGSLDLQFSDAGGSDPNWIINAIEIQPVPLPAAVWLLGSGLIGLVGLRRKRF